MLESWSFNRRPHGGGGPERDANSAGLPDGNHEALQQLLPLVYGELRRLARHHLRRRKREDTFESKALVHEAYLRVVDQDRVEWRDRTHFFGLASNLMALHPG